MRLTFVDITEGTRPEFLPVAFDVLIICGTLKPGRSHRRRVHIPRTELRQMDQTLEVFPSARWIRRWGVWSERRA